MKCCRRLDWMLGNPIISISWIPRCTLDVIQKHPAAEDSDERIGLGSLWKFLVIFRQREGHGSIGSIGWGVLVGWPWLDSATRGQRKRWNASIKNLDSCFCLQSFVPVIQVLKRTACLRGRVVDGNYSGNCWQADACTAMQAEPDIHSKSANNPQL